MEKKCRPRGRPKGSKNKQLGAECIPKYSVMGWLKQASPGDEMFTAMEDKLITSSASKIGCKIQTERWIAIHAPSRRVEDLVNVIFVERLD